MITAVNDQSQVAEARRAASNLVRALGFDESAQGRAALIATEMATNLLKHAGGGDIAVQRFEDGDGIGVELLALDNGDGMADLQRCLADGYSTAGSPGTGLGAIDRQSDRFAAFSRPGLGSALMARLVLGKSGASLAGIEFGTIVSPYPGETECGDRWAFARPNAGPTLLLVDGSGHGMQAAKAAELAVKTFLAYAERDCVQIIEALHRALAPTRGAAVAVARFDRARAEVQFVGVGNIVAALLGSDGVKRMVSHNGTTGHVAPRIRAFSYPVTSEPTIVLHSDGLTAKWDLAHYPGLIRAHPALLAGVLFRDFRRGRDDACVAAMRVVG